jgi:trans-2,3-dihydro-3-hydroxyanthranilate isomerase
MAGFRYVFVDVFTDVPLAGNQLAVFTNARDIPEHLLQQLATEIGFSETTFVLPPEAGGTARVRIFNPASEMLFAGHPILGTAFVLGGPLQLGLIELETGRGIVPVELERDQSGKIVFGRMTQPVPTVEEFEETASILAALRISGSELPVECYDNGVRHVYVALPSEADVAALRPDLEALKAVPEVGVNCFAGSGLRWKLRMFAPAFGVPEDPATGSAAGPLACHLARHGRIDWGDEIEITQGVEIGRPSTLFARAEGGGGLIDRVEVGGSAVAVARGEYQLPSTV